MLPRHQQQTLSLSAWITLSTSHIRGLQGQALCAGEVQPPPSPMTQKWHHLQVISECDCSGHMWRLHTDSLTHTTTSKANRRWFYKNHTWPLSKQLRMWLKFDHLGWGSGLRWSSASPAFSSHMSLKLSVPQPSIHCNLMAQKERSV